MQASIPRSMQAAAAQRSTLGGEGVLRVRYRTSAGFAFRLGLADEVRVGERRLHLARDLHAMS